MVAERVPLAVRRVVGDMLELVVMIAGWAFSGSLALVVDDSLGIIGSGVMSGMAISGATITGCVVSGAVWARSNLRSACDVSGFCEWIENSGQLRSFDQKKMC